MNQNPPPPQPPQEQNPNQNNLVHLHHPRSACAACKWQRRKCTQDCPFAPYFPQDSQTQFLNVHKLFGIKKIFNLIQSFDDKTERDTAMATIIMQANLREQNPVHGCVGEIERLKKEIERTQVELNLILNQLAMFRSQAAQAAQAQANGCYPPPYGFLHDDQNNRWRGGQLEQEVVQVHQSQGVLDHQFSEMFQGLNQWGLVERMNNSDDHVQLLLQGGGGGSSSNAGGMTNLLNQQEGDSALPFFDFGRGKQAIIDQSSEHVPIREEADSAMQNDEETKNFMLHMQNNNS